MQGASPVGRDAGSRSHTARMVSRSGPNPTTSWSGGVLSADAREGHTTGVCGVHDQGTRSTNRATRCMGSWQDAQDVQTSTKGIGWVSRGCVDQVHRVPRIGHLARGTRMGYAGH